jgi:vacuolar-type H+-ATPase subunit H
MEKFQSLKALVATAETEAEKFYNKGNSAAGTRLRKALQEIKTTAQEIRNEVIEKKK